MAFTALEVLKYCVFHALNPVFRRVVGERWKRRQYAMCDVLLGKEETSVAYVRYGWTEDKGTVAISPRVRNFPYEKLGGLVTSEEVTSVFCSTKDVAALWGSDTELLPGETSWGDLPEPSSSSEPDEDGFCQTFFDLKMVKEWGIVGTVKEEDIILARRLNQTEWWERHLPHQHQWEVVTFKDVTTEKDVLTTVTGARQFYDRVMADGGYLRPE